MERDSLTWHTQSSTELASRRCCLCSDAYDLHRHFTLLAIVLGHPCCLQQIVVLSSQAHSPPGPFPSAIPTSGGLGGSDQAVRKPLSRLLSPRSAQIHYRSEAEQPWPNPRWLPAFALRREFKNTSFEKEGNSTWMLHGDKWWNLHVPLKFGFFFFFILHLFPATPTFPGGGNFLLFSKGRLSNVTEYSAL